MFTEIKKLVWADGESCNMTIPHICFFLEDKKCGKKKLAHWHWQWQQKNACSHQKMLHFSSSNYFPHQLEKINVSEKTHVLQQMS